MRIDIAERKSWVSVSEKFREWLAADLADFNEPALQVQVFRGYSHALLEAVDGLAKLYSHKKTILVVGNEPAFEELVVGYSGEGAVIKRVTWAEFDDTAWVAEIERDLLLVLFAKDDPVTARLNPVEKLIAVFKDKRIFRVALSHFAHREEARVRPRPFEVEIFSLTPDTAVLLAGERFRITPALASRLPWAQPGDLEQRELRVQKAEENRSLVQSFESNLPEGFLAYFATHFSEPTNRVYDRAVIYNTGIDGSALMDHLNESSALESTSPCRSNDLSLTNWLIESGMKPEAVRGLLIIDVKLLKTGEFSQRLSTAAQTLLKLQG